jgi:hypothetical protein
MRNTLELRRQELGRLATEARQEKTKVYDSIVDALSWKQYQGWSWETRCDLSKLKRYTKSKKLLAAAARCLELWETLCALNLELDVVLEALEAVPNLVLAHSVAPTAHEILLRRVSKASKEKSSKDQARTRENTSKALRLCK